MVQSVADQPIKCQQWLLTHADVKLKTTRHEKKRAHERALLHCDFFLPHHVPDMHTICQALLYMCNKRN